MRVSSFLPHLRHRSVIETIVTDQTITLVAVTARNAYTTRPGANESSRALEAHLRHVIVTANHGVPEGAALVAGRRRWLHDDAFPDAELRLATLTSLADECATGGQGHRDPSHAEPFDALCRCQTDHRGELCVLRWETSTSIKPSSAFARVATTHRWVTPGKGNGRRARGDGRHNDGGGRRATTSEHGRPGGDRKGAGRAGRPSETTTTGDATTERRSDGTRSGDDSVAALHRNGTRVLALGGGRRTWWGWAGDRCSPPSP